MTRVKHLKDKMIKSMIDFISAQRKEVEDEHKRFSDDKEARKVRATVAKTQLEDKKKDEELKERKAGLDQFKKFTEQMAFERYHKREDFKKMLSTSNSYHVKGLLEIIRYFFGSEFTDDKAKTMKRPKMIDTITLEIIRQFPRPCLNCNCYLEEMFVIPREAVGKPSCQICGSYLCESCLNRVGTNMDHTYGIGDFNQTGTDFFNTTN